jgi:hypothetical protein
LRFGGRLQAVSWAAASVTRSFPRERQIESRPASVERAGKMESVVGKFAIQSLSKLLHHKVLHGEEGALVVVAQ